MGRLRLLLCLAFSFLYRNERTATRHAFGIAAHDFVAFSFLYRNERTATMTFPSFADIRYFFQFPLSERTNCNAAESPLSLRATIAFSFLYRNERTATRRTARVRDRHRALSVSSIGTNELQLAAKYTRSPAARCFQFPLSERTNCNHQVLQLADLAGLPFSFLYRNERTATDAASATILKISTFSFLYRNERTATLFKRTNSAFDACLSVSSIGTNELQLRCRRCGSWCIVLSVSSIGTNELQLDVAADRMRHTSLLSVSSIGTNELQRVHRSKIIFQNDHFQFPLSERTNCNVAQRAVQFHLLCAFSFLYRNERTATSLF